MKTLSTKNIKILQKNNRIIGNEEASMFIYNKIDSRTKEGIK